MLQYKLGKLPVIITIIIHFIIESRDYRGYSRKHLHVLWNVFKLTYINFAKIMAETIK